MSLALMSEAVKQIKKQRINALKLKPLATLRWSAFEQWQKTGVDYISTSAPITRQSPWLDISMRIKAPS